MHVFGLFLFCDHVLRLILKVRSALNLKSQLFLLNRFGSCSVEQIRNWLLYYAVKKTGKQASSRSVGKKPRKWQCNTVQLCYLHFVRTYDPYFKSDSG